MKTTCQLLLSLGVLTVFLSPTAAETLEETLKSAERQLARGDRFAASEAYHSALTGLLQAVGKEGGERWLPEAELALLRLERLSLAIGKSADTRALLRQWSETEPSADATYVSFLARLALGLAQPTEAAGLWRPLGFLEKWRVVGPFDNDRGGSFLTRLGPESTGKETRLSDLLEASYDGKSGTIRWRALPGEPVAGRVDFAALFRPNEEALAYALTCVRAESPGDVALRFGSNDGFRVWVNGVLVATGDVQRPFRYDQNVVGIRLQKGWNTILFKVAQAKTAWEFAVRLTQVDGKPLQGVEESWPEPADTLPSLEGPAPEIPCPGGSEALLRKRIESHPADARAHYLLGTLLLEKRAHDVGEHPDTELLKRAVTIDDVPAIYHLELARSQQRETLIAAQKDENAWRKTLEKAVACGSAAAAYQLALYYFDTFNNVRSARAYLSQALEKNPEMEEALRLAGRIEGSQGLPLAKERARRKLAGLPRRSLSQRLEEANRLQSMGLVPAAEKALREILEVHPRSSRARNNLARLLLETDRLEPAEETLRAGAALFPFHTSWHLLLARIHEGRDRFEEAIADVDRCLQIRPEDERLYERRSGLLLRLGRRDEAIAALEKALDLQPNLPRVREYLDFLQTQESEFEERFRRDAAELARAAWEETDAAEAGDPARILLDLKAIQVNEDGTTKQFGQLVVQVLNDAGIRRYDRFRTYYAEGDQVLEFKKARVLHPDGSVDEARLSRHGLSSRARGGLSEFGARRIASIDLPPLSKNDVVEIEFIREDIVQSFFGDYFGHREIFQDTVQIEKKVLILEVPANREFFFHQRNMDVKPQEERDDETETITYTWRMEKLPKLDPEPSMTPRRESSPLLDVSTFKDWDAFNTWYWNLIRKQYESSPEISKKVQELTSGAPNNLEKVRAIYNFIVTDVRYNSAWEFGVHGFKPYNAASIFTRRFGDCKDKATLMSVMLREVDIQSHPVLILLEPRRGEEDLTLPLIHHFNHCISYVPGGDELPEMFLDGTAQYHRLEQLPSADRGAKVLVVKEEGGQLLQTPWNRPEELSLSEQVVVTLRADLSAEMQVRVQCRGDFAVQIRRSFEIAAQRKTNLEQVFSRRFAASKVGAVSFSDLKNLDESVAFTVQLQIPRLLTEAPEGLVLKTPEDFFLSAQALARFGSLETRQYDLLLGNPRRSQLQATYKLPPGLEVKSLPPERDLARRFGRLRVTYQSQPGELSTRQEIEITTHRVSSKDYEEFREFSASLDRLRNEKIILQRRG